MTSENLSENKDDAISDSEKINLNLQKKIEIDDNAKESLKKNEQTVTIKKSTYGNLLKGIVVAIAISAFLAGYLIGMSGNAGSYITEEKFEAELLKFVTNDKFEKTLSNIESQPTQITPEPITQPESPSESELVQISLDDDPMLGNPNAPVTIIEFSDFQCPFCSRFFIQTLPLLEEDYIDKGIVKLVYRDLPLESIHPNAIPSHVASQCAYNQDKFWDYHDVLFERQSEWNRLPHPQLKTVLIEFASELGLDTASFEECLDSPESANEVRRDLQDGISYGITGTPTFFVGSEEKGYKKMVGALPYSSFAIAVDSLVE